MFTPEQTKILHAAFQHVWSRMARLQSDLNDDSTRLIALLQMLVDHGVLSPEQFEAAVDELTATTGIESGLASIARGRKTDEQIATEILEGDTEAFRRRRADEEEDQ